MLIGTTGILALLQIAVLAYFAMVGFSVIFILAEVLFFPERTNLRMRLMRDLQGQMGLLEPYLPDTDLETDKGGSQ